MIGFLIKKWFFDLWDNLFRLILINLGFIFLMGVLVYLPYIFRFSTLLSYIGLVIGIVGLNIYAGASSLLCRDIADYKSPGFNEFPGYVKEIWKQAVVLSVITIVQFFILTVVMPFYFTMGGVPGLFAISVLFWINIFWWLVGQYYFPVRARLDSEIRKILKKCFIIFFDNTGFSVFLGIFSIVTFLLSIFTAFLLPGMGSILLLHQVALKLRLYKYDYLEKNPGAKRKNIPWEVLLIEDKERVGTRTLKGMIFPWKE
ncbi:MAG: hypothetical protein DRP87_13505 [Spirochaetes bacterium]|nr:MAG: hypothetical protein DRP87_13505 [Spirochaetota bacterium]